MDRVPQLIIDGVEEPFKSQFKTREEFEAYLAVRLDQTDRSVMGIEYHPSRETLLENVLLIEVHTIQKKKTIEEFYRNLSLILEDGAFRSLRAAKSIRNGPESIAKDVTRALAVWSDVLEAVETIETIGGELDERLEALVGATTELLEDLDEALRSDDSKGGSEIFRKMAGLSVEWIEVLGG